jgi:hypothetical protein
VVVDVIVVVVVVLERLGLGLGLCGLFLWTDADDLNTVPIVFPIEEAKLATEFPNVWTKLGGGGGAAAEAAAAEKPVRAGAA